MGAIRGAIEIIATFSNIAGPHGQIVGVALNFISGFLTLFGKGTSPKPVSEVVREEIGAIFDFQTSKDFLDGVAKSGNNISEFEANGLGCHVPVYKGVLFMGTLVNEVRNIIRDNEIGEAKKMLKVY